MTANKVRMIAQRIQTVRMLKIDNDPVGRSFKQVDPFYVSAAWKGLRNSIIKQRGWRCQDPRCEKPRGPWKQIYGDHIIEMQDGGAPLDPRNILLRCGTCHGRKTREAKAKRAGWIDFPHRGSR